ncbi:hypothetical protein RFI_32343, partial [Reticulomyxa filosa]
IKKNSKMTTVKEKKIKIFEKDFIDYILKLKIKKSDIFHLHIKSKKESTAMKALELSWISHSTRHSYGLFVMTKDIHKVFPHGGKHVLSYTNCDVETSTTHQIHLQSQYLGLGVVSDKCYCQSEIPKY